MLCDDKIMLTIKPGEVCVHIGSLATWLMRDDACDKFLS